MMMMHIGRLLDKFKVNGSLFQTSVCSAYNLTTQ